MDRISICDSLYKTQREDTIFEVSTEKWMGDEKWIIYDNIERKRSWGKRNEPPLAIPKADLHPKKVMCSVSGGIGKRSCIMIFYQTTRR